MFGKESVKCAKCGITSKENSSLIFHRFPLPSIHGSLKARVWATFCFPNDDWTSNTSLEKLYKQHKMLCGSHFDDSSYTSSDRKRLNKFAIPTDARNLLAQLRDEQCYPVNPPIEVHDIQGSPEPATADSTHEKTHSDDGAVDADEAAARFAFSWEKPYDAIPCADESDNGGDSSSVRSCAGSDDNEIKLETHNDKLHLDFKCNECGGEIIGYRYTCVQCLAVDLCGACEAGGAHPAHYVLRLPRPEPAGAAKGVLETLRGLLDQEPPLHLPRDRIKMELDDEDPLYEPTGLRSPEPTRDESDDYESEEEKSDLETLSTASKETHTDAVVANTAQTHHQTHETATSVVKVSGPVKKKILPIRLRKPTLVKTLLVDSGAIKVGARVGPGQVGVARTGMGTGVGIPGAGVTGPGGGVRVAGVLERVSEASEKLTGADVKVSRAGIVVPGTEGMVSIPAPRRPVVVKLKRLEATLPEEAKMRKIYFDTTPSKKLS